MFLDIVLAISDVVPIWRASEDAGLSMWTANLRAILPQISKEK